MQPAAPEVKPVDLSRYVDFINTALDENVPCVLVSADGTGHPDAALKGSLHVFDNDHLAWWERSKAEQILQVEENPSVLVFYRNPSKSIAQLRFYGVATIHYDGDVRDKVMAGTPERELNQDPERKGFGVLIRVDRIRLGRNTVQQREGAA
ncbi:MAG: hypothetical protein HW416_3036 [Chloroflexi bacterium]|nr:hypothetical protein [Chloroflexota bacterium]